MRHTCAIKGCRRWKGTKRTKTTVIVMYPGYYDEIGESTEPLWLCGAHRHGEERKTVDLHAYPMGATAGNTATTYSTDIIWNTTSGTYYGGTDANQD